MKKLIFTGTSAESMYNFRRHLILHCMELGYDVQVYAPDDQYGKMLRDLDINYHPISLHANSKNPFSDLFYLLNLIRHYRREKPDLIIHYTIKPNIFGTLAAAYCGIPSWLVVTGLGYPFSRKNLLRTISIFLYKLALKRSSKAFFLNAEDAQFFRDTFHISPEKIRQLPGEGVACDYYKRTTDYPEKHKIYFIGRLLKDKGIEIFAEAIRLLSPQLKANVKFVILGPYDPQNGNSVSAQFMESVKHREDIEYMGEVTDVRPHLEKASCVVLPSYYEGIPITLLEASSMEIPIITTDTVGCRDVIIDGETGLRVKPRNVRYLAMKLATFLQLPYETRKEMGKNGRKFVCNRFSIEKVLKIYEKELLE